MTPEDCKIVTEYIGECWHECNVDSENYQSTCKKCGKWLSNSDNHIFTTWDDFGAVFEKLVEKGDLYGADSFLDWADTKWMTILVDDLEYDEHDNFIKWLLSRLPDGTYRLCQLVADSIKEGVIG